MSNLTELGQLLHEEHFRILVAVCGLENRVGGAYECQPLDAANAEDRHQLEELVAALDEVIGHHAFEETVIFPLIRQCGKRELTNALAIEHLAIEPMAMRLRVVADAMLQSGTGAERWSEFRAAASALIAEVLQHLQKEELNIVQHLDEFLDPQMDHQLALDHLADRANSRQPAFAL
ncbi:hemerythrin domain-containing protein [Defluviicoccus vanus]|uniref:Hemerythrin domain-containing protein n=1 Tax=Defluviicoccus vanus TaxID=111831 RepID=A0A7H1N548_9PROT|nr:hemerythrin domain-containing protein [Defluviicoccus vanus]QNT70834.1 hemerythrin domain-containing protein [Defluviicoccus vanus]